LPLSPIPRDLHIWEDDYIGRHIIAQGYRFLKVKNPYCLHNVSEKSLESSVLNGYLLHKYGIWSFRKVLTRFMLTIPKCAWIYAVTHDFEASKRQALTYVLTMKGWLAC
jgi:hypothetical protein